MLSAVKPVLVTDGAAFLGSYMNRLRKREWCGTIIVPRSQEIVWRDKDAIIGLDEREE